MNQIIPDASRSDVTPRPQPIDGPRDTVLVARPEWATDFSIDDHSVSIAAPEFTFTYETTRSVPEGLDGFEGSELIADLKWAVAVMGGERGVELDAEPAYVSLPPTGNGTALLTLDNAEAFANHLLELVALGRGQRLAAAGQGGAR